MEWSFSLAEWADTYFGLPSFPRWLIPLTAAYCGTRLVRNEAAFLLEMRKCVKRFFEKFAPDGANSFFIWFFRCLSPLIASDNCGSRADKEQSREEFSA
jgi:hypothetical protein